MSHSAIWMLWQGQTDLIEHGTFFSMMVIYLINFSVLSIMLIVACRDVTFSYFGKELLQGAMEFSDQLLHWAHLRTLCTESVPWLHVRFQVTKIGLPMARQPSNLQIRQLHNDQHLPASHQECAVARPSDGERTPKTASFEIRELAMDQQRIPQAGWTPIIYFRPHHDRAIALVQHFMRAGTPVSRPAATGSFQ